MKTEIILSTLLFTAVVTGYSASEEELQAARQAWVKAYLEKNHHPVPDGGIKIVPQEQLSQSSENKKMRLKARKEMKQLGYINHREPKVEQLLTIKLIAANDYKNHGNDYKPTSTHLKHRIDELKMAYTFVGVPPHEVSEIIGVAPYLTYLDNQGWVGATQFFTKEGIGTCSFSENNVKLSHGSVVIPKDEVRDDVNGKVTVVEVIGTKKTGFLYRVEWYDPTFFRELDCASVSYSKQLEKAVIDLAIKTDNFQ